MHFLEKASMGWSCQKALNHTCHLLNKEWREIWYRQKTTLHWVYARYWKMSSYLHLHDARMSLYIMYVLKIKIKLNQRWWKYEIFVISWFIVCKDSKYYWYSRNLYMDQVQLVYWSNWLDVRIQSINIMNRFLYLQWLFSICSIYLYF